MKKEATVRYTYNERKYLLNLLEKHKDVINCKESDATNLQAKRSTWAKIAEEYNGVEHHYKVS